MVKDGLMTPIDISVNDCKSELSINLIYGLLAVTLVYVRIYDTITRIQISVKKKKHSERLKQLLFLKASARLIQSWSVRLL